MENKWSKRKLKIEKLFMKRFKKGIKDIVKGTK